MPRVDYDTIADVYDRDDYRAKTFDAKLGEFIDVRGSIDGLRILDVGCGTGQQLAANLAELAGATLVGVDRYSGMLRQAKRRCNGVGLVQGDGVDLPFPDATFDYISNQFSYHHVGRTPAFVREVFRVLRPKGRFVITNMDPWEMDDWICYRYFPTARDVDHRDFVQAERLVGFFRDAGFRDVGLEQQRRPSTIGTLKEMLEWSLLRNTTSQLLAISDEDYESGIARIRADLAANPDATAETVSARIALWGTKPD
jgi:ubiquinone/menaquinone biosynthesis C-methylase UbiE